MAATTVLFCCGPKDYHDQLEFTKSDSDATVSEAPITNPIFAPPNSYVSKITVGIVANYYEKNSSYFGVCSGVKLDSKTILTAAHCISKMETMRVVYGKSIASAIDNKDVYEIQHVVIHSHYLQPKVLAEKRFFDIALVRLKNPLPHSENEIDVVSQFELLTTAQRNQVVHGMGEDFIIGAIERASMIAGFGLSFMSASNTGQHKKSVGLLTEAAVQLNLSQYSERIIEISSKAISQACVGDSGGPLYIWPDNKYYVQGIAISVKEPDKSDPFATSICENQSYYLNIDFFGDWIKTTYDLLQK